MKKILYSVLRGDSSDESPFISENKKRLYNLSVQLNRVSENPAGTNRVGGSRGSVSRTTAKEGKKNR